MANENKKVTNNKNTKTNNKKVGASKKQPAKKAAPKKVTTAKKATPTKKVAPATKPATTKTASKKKTTTVKKKTNVVTTKKAAKKVVNTTKGKTPAKKTTTKKTTNKTVPKKVEKKVVEPVKKEEVKKVVEPVKKEEPKKAETKKEQKVVISTNVIYTIIGLTVLAIVIILTIVIKPSNSEYNKGGNTGTTTNPSSPADENIPEDQRKELNTINIDQYLEMLKGEETKIIYIGRPTCGHCVKQKPIMENIKFEYDVEINYLNTDEFGDGDINKLVTSNEYFNEGFGTPLTLIVKDNKILDKAVGETSKKEMVELFKKYSLIK